MKHTETEFPHAHAFEQLIDLHRAECEGEPDSVQLTVAREFWRAGILQQLASTPADPLVAEFSAEAKKISVDAGQRVHALGERIYKLLELASDDMDGRDRWLFISRVVSGVYQQHFQMSISAGENQIAREITRLEQAAKVHPISSPKAPKPPEDRL